jgi:crotonobetaine/carnitine-CoA ligase
VDAGRVTSIGHPEVRQSVTHEDAGSPWSEVKAYTVVQLVADGCRAFPQVPAVIFEDGLTITRGQLLGRAQAFAGYLLDHTSSGERVASMLDNRAEAMIVFLAALLAERTLVPINPASRDHDAAHVLSDSESVLLIVSDSQEPLAERLRRECVALRSVLIVRDAEPDGLLPFSIEGSLPGPEDCQAKRNSIATIYYTSGTTGLPKGCVLDHQWWLRLCDIHLRLTRISGQYRPLCCVPFYYADSMFQLLCAIHAGGTLIAMRRFSVSRFWDVVSRHQASELYLLASMPILLLKQSPHPAERQHKLQVAICAAVPASLHRQLVDRFAVQFIDSYGSTEAGWNIRVPRGHGEEMIGSGSMGVSLPELELRIVDGTDSDVPIGEPGELLVRGPGLFAGYLDNPGATSEAMRGGWYHTGDVVRVDERGFHYFVGRKKDIVRRSGENISAAEVEEVLRIHEIVLDAAVVPTADEIRGEEAKAHILVRDSRCVSDLVARELVAHCAARLAPFKVPRYLVFRMSDFPRTPTMRIRKAELAADELSARVWDRTVDGWVDTLGSDQDRDTRADFL